MVVVSRLKSLFNVKEWAPLETLFALYPIVSGWTLGPYPLYLIFALIMDLIAYRRHGVNFNKTSKKMKVLFWFVMFHNFIWIFVIDDVSSVFFNSWVGTFITMSSVFFIAPVIQYHHIKRPLFAFSIIAMIGLAFQLIQLARGIPIGQLAVPPFSPSRLVNDTSLLDALRPSGFFAEPAAFAQYLFIPLFITLTERKYLFSFIIVVFSLLSTSTTALVICFLMLIAYFFTSHIPIKWKFVVVVATVGIAVLLTKTELFESTMEKAEKTDLSENERTSIGFKILPQLNAPEMIFGIPYHSISDMFNAGRLKINTFYFYENNKAVIFVPTFWYMLFIYGIFGLIIYLSVFWEIFRKSKIIFPFLLAVVARVFSDPTALGATFLFELSFMYAFIRYEQSLKLNIICING